MVEETKEIPFLMNIGFFITYKCQISCPHCIVNAGPDRKEVMRTEDILNWIDQTADYALGKIKVVSFTGGEPFYDIAAFRRMTGYAASRGLVPTAVTNAFWAHSEQKALEVLKSLPVLKFLSISTDEHHLSCIPLERIKNAVKACEQLEVVYSLTISTENVNSETHLRLLEELHNFTNTSRINTVITFPVGRAESNVNPASYQRTHAIPDSACGDAHTPVIFPDGNIYACIGPVITIKHDNPLMLGNLKCASLAEILDGAQRNTILHIIRTWGPKYLLEMIRDRGYKVRADREYINGSTCDLCHTLMNDRGLIHAMHEIRNDREIIEKTACARKFYMNETEMLEALGLSID